MKVQCGAHTFHRKQPNENITIPKKQLTPLVLSLSFMILKKETPTSYKICFNTYFASKRGLLC